MRRSLFHCHLQPVGKVLPALSSSKPQPTQIMEKVQLERKLTCLFSNQRLGNDLNSLSTPWPPIEESTAHFCTGIANSQQHDERRWSLGASCSIMGIRNSYALGACSRTKCNPHQTLDTEEHSKSPMMAVICSLSYLSMI